MKFSANDVIERTAPQPAPHGADFTADENEKLLRIISQASRIRRHYELFQLLRGEVQYFIPHQILISAWGDFQGSELKLDVISPLPGVRTGRLNGCNIGGQLRSLHARWLVHGRQPVLLDNTADQRLIQSGCGCALHKSMQSMVSVLLHGVHDKRDGTESLYVAANAGPMVNETGAKRIRRIVDPVIVQIDVAFRRVAGWKLPFLASIGEPPSSRRVLSAREAELIAWLAQGRTNLEIAEILEISPFTVKNHVQRIIRKLGAANRTEAVAKYRHGSLPTRKKSAAGGLVQLVE